MAREPEMHFSLLALGILAVILFGIQDCFPPYTAFTSTLVTGAGRPVRRIIGSRSSAREVTFHSFEFQSIYFGREGPNYMSIKGEPSKGAQQLAKAELFGQEEVTTAKFELTDEAGNVLELLHLDPLPDVQYPLQRPDLLKYDTAAGYRANTVYHFTVDMIPDYVIQNAKKTKFCIYVQRFGGSPKRLSLWEALSTNGMPIKYRIDIRNTDFNGETDNFHAQKVFLASFVNEGSQDCGPNPNINF